MDDRVFGRLVIGMCLVLMPSERVWSSIAGIGSLYSDITPVYLYPILVNASTICVHVPAGYMSNTHRN